MSDSFNENELTRPRCNSCKHFRALDEEKGECRFYAPAMDEERNNLACWAIVMLYEWCGSHKAWEKDDRHKKDHERNDVIVSQVQA